MCIGTLVGSVFVASFPPSVLPQTGGKLWSGHKPITMVNWCLVHICPGRRAINLSTIFRAIFGRRRWLRATAYMCSHCLRASCDFFSVASGATRGKSVQRLCGDCTDIVQCQCSCRAVSAASARKSYGARVGISLRTVPVRGLCNATYDMSTSTVLRFFQICKTSR